MSTVLHREQLIDRRTDKERRMIHIEDELDNSKALCGYKYKGDETYQPLGSNECVVCAELDRKWSWGQR